MRFSVTEDLSMTKIENRGVGWAMHVYGTSESDTGMIYYKTCLGVFKCTMCDFVERPRQPLATRKNAKPQEPRKHCLQHGSLGEWQQCDATLKVHVPHRHMDEPVVITFTHVGLHRHPRPPPIRPDGIGRQTLDGVVNIAPELPPKNLQVGTATRKPAPEFHPAYANLDRISNHRRHTISKHAPGNTLGDLSAYETELDDDFIQSSSMAQRDQHFSIQTLFFREEYIHTLKECMQSDSIHGWIVDGKHNDVNLTVTSTFCPAIKRTVPVLISVMHGKSSVHYEQHFLALLRSLPYATWDDFQENFPGMTCDFSDALRIGFEDALRNFYHIAAETNITLERFYRFCHVHYKRSLTRVRRNHGIIPAAEENEFYKLGLCLLEVETESKLEDVVQKILRQYPNSKNWIEWYLHPSRARHIFPAMAIHDYSAMAKDTNAQESIRGDIKRTSGKKKISVVEAGRHAVAYMHRIEEDYQLAMTGAQLRYKKNRRTVNKKVRWKAGEAYSNDGRAPDTTKSLVGISKRIKTKAGRPRGSRNKVPKLEINLKTFGIPWSFTHNGFTGQNTCPLDTTLTAWYLLYKHRGARLPHTTADSDAGQTLSVVLEHMDQGEYDHARWLWCTKAMGCERIGNHDLFLSMEDVFLDFLPGLICFDVEMKSHCESSDCPEPYHMEKKRLSALAVLSAHITQHSVDMSLTPVNCECSAQVEKAEEQ